MLGAGGQAEQVVADVVGRPGARRVEDALQHVRVHDAVSRSQRDPVTTERGSGIIWEVFLEKHWYLE